MRRLLLPLGLVALAVAAYLLSRPQPAPGPAAPFQPAQPAVPSPPGAAVAAPAAEVVDVRRAARDLRKQARTEPTTLRRLIQILQDAGRPSKERELAACVLGSLPDPEALLALSQALAQATDPAWTRLLLLCIGSAKDWGEDDDAFGMEGRPYAVVVPLGLALIVQHVVAEDVVRRQIEGFLGGVLAPAVREAAALALRHSLAHADVRASFLDAAKGGADAELQGFVAGPLAEWASRQTPEIVERGEILGAMLSLGAAPDADPLRFNIESGFKGARLNDAEVTAIPAMTEGVEFDVRRWALSILGSQAARADLPGRTSVRDRVTSILAKDPDAKIREFAAAGLAAFGGDAAAQSALETALVDVAWNVRARAAESLGRWPAQDGRASLALRRAMQDENASVRAAAEAGLRSQQSRR